MSDQPLNEQILTALNKIADSLETLSGRQTPTSAVLTEANAYHWEPADHSLVPVPQVNRVQLSLLQGIDDVSNILLNNTEQFAKGFAANNALLWGARGMGKSSLVKAIHADICDRKSSDLRLILIEISREDLPSLPILMRMIADSPAQFIIFCDDLSFDRDETSYKSLKTVLDGGLEGRAKNTLFYATSNRRHLMPRDMIENESAVAINSGEAVQEKVSLSDRFGLWLGFHDCDQPTYLSMVDNYVTHYQIGIDQKELHAKAIEWSVTRGARSGRVAMQFIRHIAGEMGKAI